MGILETADGRLIKLGCIYWYRDKTTYENCWIEVNMIFINKSKVCCELNDIHPEDLYGTREALEEAIQSKKIYPECKYAQTEKVSG